MSFLDDVFELGHEFFVNGKAAGGIEDDDIVILVSRLLLSLFCEDNRTSGRVNLEEIDADFLGDGPKLIDSGWTVNV